MTALIMTADKIGLSLVADWFKRLNAHFKAKRLQKRTITELHRLSDRELADIGLHRGMVETTAWEAYYIEKQRLGGAV